ncbi:MAG: hypothetical protein ACR2JK_08275 [Geodermatophilaceae bacterium]
MTDFGVQVGVLLPARLETRLDTFPDVEGVPPEQVGHRRLRVLVVPDAPSFDVHDPTVRTDELDRLDAAWAACTGDLTTPEGGAAFDALVGALGAGRATYLLRRFPAVLIDGAWQADRAGGQVRDKARGPVLRGLPTHLELWALVPDARVLLASWERPAVDLPVVPQDPAQLVDGQWWPDWGAATAAGLTAVVDLEAPADPDRPGPVEPEQIEAIVLQGLSGAPPLPLLAAHADGGGLELSAPGLATNTVHGNATTDRDPHRLLDRVSGQPGPAARAAASLLCADPESLGPLPGGEQQHDEGQGALVAATWAALAGHPLKDLWGLDGGDGAATFRLGDWAQRHLRPEGPLPPLLVRGQPYGVLPVTALDRWDAAGDSWGVERDLAALVLAQAPTGARRAEDTLGTVVAASVDQAYALLAQVPTSNGYATRTALPLDVLLAGFTDPATVDRINGWWDAQAVQVVQPPLQRPRHPVWTLGWPWDVRIPLLAPSDAEGPGQMLEALFEDGMSKDPDDWHRDLLQWLLEHGQSLQDARVLAADFFVRAGRLPDSLLFRVCLMALLLAWSEVARSTNGRQGPLDDAEGELVERLDQGPGAEQAEPIEQLKMTLEALDRLVQGTDPAAAVERRFRGMLDVSALRLDAYATALPWRRLSTAPFDTEPRGLGLYGWVDRPFRAPSNPGPTQGGLLLAPSDAQARTALVLRDRAVHDRSPAVGGGQRWDLQLASADVRLAAEVVDEVLAGAHPGEALGRMVEAVLDADGPIRAARTAWAIRPEHAGRRTCDGLQVVHASAAQVTAVVGPLRAEQTAALEHLRTFAATVADLLLAQGVWDVVQGRYDQAGAATDAAAGLAQPPDLQVLRTERTSTPRSTAVAVVLPDAAPPGDPAAASPVALADPAVAAWLAAESAGLDLTWPTSAEPVSLADLGLAAVDCLVLADDEIGRLAALASGGAVTAVPDGPRRVRRLADAVRSQPPSRPALAPGTPSPSPDPLDATPELAVRYAAVRDALMGLHDELAAPGGDTVALLLRAVRWGVAPVPSGPLDPGEPADPVLLDLRARSAAALANRLAAPLPAPSAGALATATGELVGPGGRVPVLGRVAVADLPALTASPTGALGRPALDATWLELLSAVRPRLAGVDAHQASAVHRGAPPWAAWTSRPDDVWQLATGDQLLVAYGPTGAVAGATVALGVLDAFTEQVPDTSHTAGGALAFNTPGARAPQAVLVAVTPVEGATLDSEVLLETLVETRDLARARMLRPEDSGPWDAGALALLPADDRGGFRPDPEGAWF